MKDCPPNAIRRAESGEVYINDSCIGCGNCVANCPYKVISLNYDAPAKPGLFSWLMFGSGSGPGQEDDYEVSDANSPAHVSTMKKAGEIFHSFLLHRISL